MIIYFSLSGTTKQAALELKKITDEKVVELQAQEPYPDGYENYVKVAENQLNNNIHPAIKTEIPDLQEDKLIYLGFPTWWHQPPMIIDSLFEKFDFSGKTIIPFTTSMSDSISESMPYLRKLADEDHATLEDGFRYTGDSNDMIAFLKQNNLIN